MTMEQRMDNPFLPERKISADRARGEQMKEELGAAAASAREKIRASFGLIADRSTPDKIRGRVRNEERPAA